VDLSVLVAYAGAVQQLLATIASLSVRVISGWFASCRPRYLLHGTVALIGMATVTTFALQPRSAVSNSSAAAAAAAVVNPSPPLMALNVEEPAPVVVAEEPTATPTAVVEQEPPAKPFTYTVEEGETVRMLAARFSLSPATILSANNLRDPDLLQVGQELTILPSDGVLHTLRAGESIRRVAERYGVPTVDIIKANDLGKDPDLVQPGTQLMVPGAEPVLPTRRGIAQSGDDDQQAASVGGGAQLPINVQAVPSTRTYEVQKGDTLISIAETFGVDVDTILSSNGIDDPDTIKPGSELRILPVKGLEYTIQPSETLADISWRYQVDLGLLLDYNDLNDPDMIRVGAKLVVPGGRLRADAAPAPAAIEVPAARTGPGGAAVVTRPAAPAAAPKPAARPAAPAPPPGVGRGGANNELN
jgi:LysM repeat protein